MSYGINKNELYMFTFTSKVCWLSILQQQFCTLGAFSFSPHNGFGFVSTIFAKKYIHDGYVIDAIGNLCKLLSGMQMRVCVFSLPLCLSLCKYFR